MMRDVFEVCVTRQNVSLCQVEILNSIHEKFEL